MLRLSDRVGAKSVCASRSCFALRKANFFARAVSLNRLSIRK
jgi:hypothetical protein